MTFKEDFKPSRVYNKLVIDAINKDIANDRSIIIPNTFDIDIKNNNKKYLCGTGRMECFDTGKIIKRYYSNVGINAWREIVELRSIILHELFYFINYTICFNSNVVNINSHFGCMNFINIIKQYLFIFHSFFSSTSDLSVYIGVPTSIRLPSKS